MSPQEIADLRERHGLSQRVLAEKIGCSQGWISQRERGKADITSVDAMQIRHAVGEGPPPPTGKDLKGLRKRLDLSLAAFAPLIGRSRSTAQRYEGARKRRSISKVLPADVAACLEELQEEKGPLSPRRYAALTGQALLKELSGKVAAEEAGEPVRLLPFASNSESLQRTRYVVGESGAVYTFRARGFTEIQARRVGGQWRCTERSTKNGQVALRVEGKDTAMSHQRVVALAWLGDPPFESAEAYRPDPERPPSKDNVGWRSFYERFQEYVDSTKNKDSGRMESKIHLDDAVQMKIRQEHSEEVRRNGLTYAANAILRRQLGLPKAPTPHERKTGRRPDTKAARILLAARKNPDMTYGQLAEEAETTPGYVGRVISKSSTTLEELRRQKERDRLIEESQRKNRDRNLASDAGSGLFTRKELAEKYELSGQHVQNILNDAGVSLAEAKRERKKAVYEKQKGE